MNDAPSHHLVATPALAADVDMRAARRGGPVMNVTAISPTTPLRLAVAAEIAFPGGDVTAATLRREGAKGRLAIERIGRKDFTTLAAIDSMRLLCRVNPKESDSGSDRHEAASAPSSSFETEQSKSAQAALSLSLSRLRESSPTTSRASISPTDRAALRHRSA
jgi:hypothetical protein